MLKQIDEIMTGKQDVSPLDALPLAEPLASQLRFLLEADRLKSVIRGSRIADGSRRENSAEHSWHIALFALVLAHHAAERIDALRVVSMLLIHDLVEIDCGDTPLFDAAAAATQPAREAIAARRLFGLLPAAQAGEFLALWQEFEAAATADARFAKSVDRLQPTLLNHAVGGGTWTDYDVDEARERALTCHIAEGSPALWEAAQSVVADSVRRGWLKPARGT
jgi:5'-deoxynucleotidase YfbR-like HD superfamily hydrolase